ncbi:THUMP-like domain-containing protein [Psychroflexus salis]|uniref:THUMP-like domain-containing protein n=1 Tax=Psychroflexus salis TaxID=1526574 RepID=A0A916ZXS6_9FLAO|nr:class I SAM-dependent methyltransferase [Psychroflexus salis]GGE18162.1 hypothetical protein GCM10010831_19210 [Psychroflexus salis]
MLSKEHIKFIQNNLGKNVSKLILKGIPFSDVSTTFIAQQIAARQNLGKKLPNWVKNTTVVFPKKLNLEQSSSEQTAQYKSKIIQGNKIVCDLTGGFGIDTFALSGTNKKIIYIEKDNELAEIVKHNICEVFEKNNVEFEVSPAELYLENLHTRVDWLYMDPSRRNTAKQKVFLFEECEPNILDVLNLMKDKSKKALIKTSPLIDICYGIKNLKYVNKIHVVCVGNELKELLWELDFSVEKQKPTIKTIQYKSSITNTFNFCYNQSTNALIYSEPLQYLYEPNAALMKVGKFEDLAEVFQLKKLHPNSHLFTSNQLIKAFPGRAFLIKEIIDYKPKSLKKTLKNKKINVSTRNFPIMAKDLIKLFKINEGGNQYAFFTTDKNQQKKYILCTKEY